MTVMFEAAELGRKIDKKTYKAQLPELRAQLLQAQFALSKTNTPVILMISGVDAAGRGDVVNALNEWLDPRGLQTFAIESLTDEERERPYFWRYWRRLPQRGRIGIFFGGWYVDPIKQVVNEEINEANFEKQLSNVRRFENMIVEDDALILKFWLHLPKEEQRNRLKSHEKDKNAKRLVSKQDWKNHKLYDKYTQAAELAIRHTDTGGAPWTLVESTDSYYRDLTIGQTVLHALQKRLAEHDAKEAAKAAKKEAAANAPVIEVVEPKIIKPKTPQITVLDRVDLDQKLSSKEYRRALEKYQGKLNRLAWAAHHKKRSLVAVFEGWDAAGKGGEIRRMTQAMDSRLYQVISVAAPTDEERAQHYLWRFWRHIPRAGNVTMYDRSWYGRVLVERIEGFAQEEEWKRAFLEINDFEEQLANDGAAIVKFWVHISKEEQLRRFKEREKVAYKQHKLTEEDWRNRERWDEYTAAINDMVARTSTDYAPWTLVAGNDKRFGRIQALKTVCNSLEKVLDK